MKKITFPDNINVFFSNNLFYSIIIFICFTSAGSAQQNVFSRSEVNTGNWGDGSNPWYYATSNNSQGDPDNNNSVRNFVKIGHNNNTTMTTNGRFYMVNSLDFEAGASTARTINNNAGGLSVSGGIYNASSATHVFNTPIGIDGSTVQLHANSTGGLTFTTNIFINANTVQFGNSGSGNILVSGILQGSGQVQKTGSNTLTLSGANTYTGTTTITSGTLVLNRIDGNAIPSTNNVTVNGGTLRISSNHTLANLILTSGRLTVDAGVTLTLTNATIPNNFMLTNNGTIAVTGTLTDNRIAKSYGGTIEYTGSSQTVVAASYGNLSLLNSGIKAFGGETTISGNLIVTDAAVTAPSKLTFSGSSAQNIAGLTFNNVEFSGAGTKTFTSNASIKSTSAVTFSGTGATVDFDGVSDDVVFELKSNLDGTSSVGNATGWTLNGKVTVERYIPAKRAWRLLTAPLKGNANTTISSNWQGIADEGLLLFSPASLSYTGYVTGGTLPNIRKYNAGYQDIPNLTTEPLFGVGATDTKSFLVFATGPSNSSNIVSGANETTLKPKGQLITGDVNHSSLAGNTFHLLSNPYASAINPVSLIANNSGHKLWLIDPSLGSFGAYVTYDGSNWSLPTPTGTDALIQSGQGFFTRSGAASTFSIKESDKAAGSSNTWFEKNANTVSTVENADKIRVLLYKNIDNNFKLADAILSVNYNEGSNEINAMDSNKISNFNESIMFRNNTTNLSIEHRALPLSTEIQPVRLTGTSVLQYQLRVYTENYTNSALIPVLEDTVNGTFTEIPMDGSVITIPFTGVVSSSTNPDNRFQIVYQTNLSTVGTSKLVASVFPNPITNNQLNVNLGTNTTPADYTITNLLGQAIQKGKLANTQNVIQLSASQGFYILNITQEGKSFTTKIYVQ